MSSETVTMKAPVLIEVELFENQRRFPLSGWTTKRLPSDRCGWSSRDGVERTKNEIQLELPSIYTWTCEWELDIRVEDKLTDKDGWTYAFDFPYDFHPDSSMHRHVRRRRWVRRAQRPDARGDTVGGDEVKFFTKFVDHAMITDTDPQFDLVEEAEVNHLQRQLEFIPEDQWEQDKKVHQCRSCSAEFGIMKRRHHCRACGKIFCDDCCKPNEEYQWMRICKLCIRAEEDRLREEQRAEREKAEREHQERLAKMAWEAAVKQNFKLEEDIRLEIVMQRSSQLERFAKVHSIEHANAQKAAEDREEDEREDKEKAAKNSMQDSWSAIKGKRSGSLTITVERAKGLVPRRPFLSCNARPIIYNPSGEGKEYPGPEVQWSVDPEFDFDEYFAVEDDRKPILITMREMRTGGTICIGKLDLRYPYENLVKEVTNQGVYTEFGHIKMDVYNKDGEVYPSTTITVKWRFEGRQVETTVFCDDCGKVEHRCSCDAETIKKRREIQNMERMREQAAIAEAREEREAKERQEAEELAAKEAKWRQEQLIEILDKNDFEEREARHSIEEHETKQFMWHVQERFKGASEIRDEAIKAQALQNAVKEVGRMMMSNDVALQSRCLGHWHLFAAMRIAKKQEEDENLKVSSEMKEAIATMKAAQQEAEKERKEREAEQRKKEEMDTYDEGKDDLDNVKRGNDGAPRVVEHKDDNAKVASQDSKGCCIAM